MSQQRPGRRVSRRQFIVGGTGVAAGAAMFGLASCGSDDGGESASASQSASGSASAAPTTGGIMQFAVTDAAPAESLDPATTYITDDAAIGATLYEGLVRYDSNWEIIPAIAESWDVSEDATEWTFTLREGVTFHDGKPVTAEDVGYSIERNLDPDLGSAIYSRLSESLDAKGIEAVDDTTITFKLKRPDSLFTLVVGTRQGHVVPAGTKDFSDGNGSGPFRLVSFNPGRDWEVEKNPDYWDTGKPYLDGVRGVAIKEQATKVQSVVSGDSHIGDRMDASLVQTVTSSDTAVVLTVESQNFLDIAMDATQDPFTDPKIQMAVKMAVDRDALLTIAQQGYGSVTSDVPVPADDPFFPQSIGVRQQDIEGAKALLAEAGYADGIDLTLYTSDVFGGLVDMAVAFKEIVAPAGIRVEVEKHPTDTYWDQVWLVKPMYCSYYNRRHPNEALNLTYTTNAEWNEGRYNNPDLDALLAEGLATTDPAEQNAIYQEALALVANEAGMMIPYFIDTQWPAKTNVNGMIFDPSRSIMFHEAWLAS